uniref:Uncharacterized protein n=1 Tax=Rhodnius prolixus TaxID=13249 RepID=A0A4P6DCJ5_RHOPR
MKLLLCTWLCLLWSVTIAFCSSDRIESEQKLFTLPPEVRYEKLHLMLAVPYRKCPPGTRRLAIDGSCRDIIPLI